MVSDEARARLLELFKQIGSNYEAAYTLALRECARLDGPRRADSDNLLRGCLRSFDVPGGFAEMQADHLVDVIEGRGVMPAFAPETARQHLRIIWANMHATLINAREVLRGARRLVLGF